MGVGPQQISPGCQIRPLQFFCFFKRAFGLEHCYKHEAHIMIANSLLCAFAQPYFNTTQENDEGIASAPWLMKYLVGSLAYLSSRGQLP